MYNVLYIQKTHHDLFLSGPILHRKCSVRNKMFGFTLALNLNLHSGSCSVVLLNLTPNIMFGLGLNIVHNVRNRTVASLLIWSFSLTVSCSPDEQRVSSNTLLGYFFLLALRLYLPFRLLVKIATCYYKVRKSIL